MRLTVLEKLVCCCTSLGWRLLMLWLLEVWDLLLEQSTLVTCKRVENWNWEDLLLMFAGGRNRKIKEYIKDYCSYRELQV